MSSSRDETLEKVKGSGRRGFARLVFGRTIFFFLCIAAQVFVLWVIYRWLDERYQVYGYGLSLIIGAILAIYILNDNSNQSFKLAWIVPVLLFPVFGGFMYVFVHLQQGNRRMNRRISEVKKETDRYMIQDPSIPEEMEEKESFGDGTVKHSEDARGHLLHMNIEVIHPLSGDHRGDVAPEESGKVEYPTPSEHPTTDYGAPRDVTSEAPKKKVVEGAEACSTHDGMNIALVSLADHLRESELHGT